MTRLQPSRSRGMTLIELMVALTIGLIIALAAVAALTASRQGYTTVDAASQLRDNGRFASELIQRVIVQAGFKDVGFVTTARSSADAANPLPWVFGANNAKPDSADPTTFVASGVNGSDVLVLRYQIPETFPGSGTPDGSMIDCAGQTAAAIPMSRDDGFSSVFYVDTYRGEPTLMCVTVSNAAGTVGTPRPIASGVETFQVLYGVDGVQPNTAPSLPVDSVADRFLRADEMDTGAAASTLANWRRVRSVRVGLVLRAAPGSAAMPSTAALYPLGQALAADTTFTPASDTRLRQVVSFTVHLRNDVGS